MVIFTYDHAKHQHLLPSFGDIHVACMEHDRTAATILTYDREKATKIYRVCAEETLVSSSCHHIITCLLRLALVLPLR